MITKISKYLGVILILILLFSGCATRSEIKRFQQQLDYLTESNAKQQQQLARIDSLINVQEELTRELKANQELNMQSIIEELRLVENILNDRGYQVSTLTKRLDELQENIDKSKTLPADSSDTSSNEIQATVNPKKLFETAQLDYNRSKFELAKMEFEQFLSIFPKSSLADDAQYYIGECLFALGKFDDAKRAYLKVKSDYPKSELIPSALYNAAVTSLKMDDISGAKKFLKELITDYPASPESAPAKEKLKMLGE